MTEPGEEGSRLLQHYLCVYLWPDDGWLQVEGRTATYWQARLAQTTDLELLSDGKAKWRVRTRIVEDVVNADGAVHLCLALNWYAAGWSFAYDAELRTIDAIVAMCAPPAFDTFLLRLSEIAKLSAWMSDVIAERMAGVVGGKAAFSHPEGQQVREHFDGTHYYLETLRGRPEWILDLTQLGFPPMSEIAAFIAHMIAAPEDEVGLSQGGFRMPAEDLGEMRAWLEGGFGLHPVVGAAWRSAVWLEGSALPSPLHVNAMTWELFNDPQANLLGSWTYNGDEVLFVQWNTMSEIRYQEQLGSYHGKHPDVRLF